MSEAQKQVTTKYFEILRMQALSAALAAALRANLLEALFEGQKDVTTLAQQCQLNPRACETCLNVLVAAGILERYREDYALSQTMRLLMGADTQFQQNVFEHADSFLRLGKPAQSLEQHHRRLVDRQWTHTAAAMQMAEVLQIGSQRKGLEVLDLGCGAGVFSAAMAYRDPDMKVTLVDSESNLRLAMETYQSIEIDSRAQWIADDYRRWDVPLERYDLVLLPEVVQLEQDSDAVILLGRACDGLRVGGEVIVVEPLLEQDGPLLSIRSYAFELGLACDGVNRSAASHQQLMRGAGFADAQWGWLTDDDHGLGIIVAKKLEATK